LNDEKMIQFPPKYLEVLKASKLMNFKMCSDVLTGNLLETLAATKPKGRFLEIGTGTGLSATWILNGMDFQSSLLSVDNNPELISVAEQFIRPSRWPMELNLLSLWRVKSSISFSLIHGLENTTPWMKHYDSWHPAGFMLLMTCFRSRIGWKGISY